MTSFLHRKALESFDDNPFLKAFYKGEKTQLLQLEKSLLNDRIEELQRNQWNQEPVISDFWVRKSLAFSSVNLSAEQQVIFKHYYKKQTQAILQPDVLIFIDITPQKAIRNIQKRQRKMEQRIDPHYLEQLSHAYQKMVHHCSLPVIYVDYDQRDLIHVKSDYEILLNKLKQKLLPQIYRL